MMLGYTVEMRKVYPSDISREQFAEIESMLLSARKKTKPRKVDLYNVFCAVLYVLKSGCQWSMIPSDFPPKSTVYTYFKQWKEKSGEDELSLLERALKKSGWRGSYQTWSERANELCNR
jgi:transposase